MSPEELQDKLRASHDLPYGPARTAAVEEVIRHADALGLAELQYAARIFSLQAYRYGAEPAKTFVPFAWCLAAYDRGEGDQRFDHHLFWNFKGIVSALADFPEVPLAQTQAVLDDMERRYRLAGHGLNPVHQYREMLARHIGDRDTAAEQFRLWDASPRGELSDCVGCEPNGKINHLVWLGRDEDAVAAALPVLTGQLNCREQPHSIRTDLLLPYLRTGRLTEAAQAHRGAYRAIQHDRAELGLIAEHLVFCACTGNHPRGLDILTRHLGWLDEPSNPNAAMRFAAAGALVLTQVIEAGHPDTPVRRPAHRDRAAVDWPATALRDELAEQALDLAARFDARNGSSEQGDRIRATLSAEPLVEHLPLSGPARAATSLPVAAPPPVSYPDTPEDLADAAEAATHREDDEVAAAVWARFDQVCPQPPPPLRARRLAARAQATFDTDPDGAKHCLRESLGLFAEHGEPVRAETTRSRLGLVHCYDGDGEAGLALLRAAIEALRTAGDEEALIRAQSRLVDGHSCLDEDETAARLARDLVERTDGHLDRQLAADMLVLATHRELALGEEGVPAALAYARRGLAVLRELPPGGALWQHLCTTGNLTAATGELEAGYTLLTEAFQAVDPVVRSYARHEAGRVAMAMEREADGYRHLTDAVADALRHQVESLPRIRIDLAIAAMAVDLPEEAADALEEAIAAIEDPDLLARARFLLHKAYRELGQPDSALALIDQVAAHCTATDNTYGLAQMHDLAADILDGLDRDALAAQRHLAAAEVLRQVEETLRELGHRRRAALSWHWAREPEQARAALAAADQLATRLGQDPEEVFNLAILDYDAARILSADEDLNPALDRANAAAEKFRSLDGAVEPTLTADVLRGRLLVQLGRGAQAHPLLTAALAQLAEDAPQRAQIEQLLTEIGPVAEDPPPSRWPWRNRG
ncbi:MULTISPECIES: hypothetical protein [unclassified Crossiella]|uniref:hypothetical protein n=1 Tax=unclassified Crossiella TaxID=2620835 RepID=UPI001FFEC259|nr:MULTISPECIES: hypothetical protein [unclassified Crossiella]MCK2239572.1 hypothetical protein [Crossiella sp. S99.2]MCK2252267.1 hypothetical protein [Crossiella sp. S99.1]